MAVANASAGLSTFRSVTTSGVAFAVLLLALLALWPTVADLARYWWQVFDYQHGLFVGPLALVLVALQRRALDSLALSPSFTASGALAATLVLWLLAFTANSALGQQLLLPLILWLAVFAACGWRCARLVALPIAYLYFAIPVWDLLVPFLQQMIVAATEFALRLLNIPTQIEGTLVSIPEGSFHVAEGCSGKRYLMVATATASLAGLLEGLSRRRFVTLVATAIGLAVLANWLRIMIVILAGHVTNMQHYFVAVEHNTLGWVIFGILVLAIAYLAYRYRDYGERKPAVPSAQPQRAPWPAIVVPVVLMIMAFVATPRLNAAEKSNAHLGALPVLADRWQGPLPVSGEWRPHFVGPTRELRAAYDSEGGGVEVYANVYGVQVPGRELIFYANSLQASGEWSDLRLAPAVSSGGPLEEDGRIRLLVSGTADGQWLVSYVYVIDGRVTGSEWLAQVFYGLRSLRGVAPSGVLAVAARCAADCDAARSLLGAFWKDQGQRFIGLIGNGMPGVSG